MTDFGTDSSCVRSIKTGRLVSGARLVAEAAYRRLTTPRGKLQGGDEEQNFGFDLVDMIGSAQTKSSGAALEGQIQAELLKDERIASVKATVTSTVDGPAIKWTISIEGTTAAGPFSLVLSVQDVTIELLGINAES